MRLNFPLGEAAAWRWLAREFPKTLNRDVNWIYCTNGLCSQLFSMERARIIDRKTCCVMFGRICNAITRRNSLVIFSGKILTRTFFLTRTSSQDRSEILDERVALCLRFAADVEDAFRVTPQDASAEGGAR